MWWLDLLVACGGAVVGAVTAELLSRSRGARDRVRAELAALHDELARATTDQAAITARLGGLTDRVDDVLDRLNTGRSGAPTERRPSP